jgi:hypothetical protein
MWVAYAMVWLSTSIAVSVAIYFTHSAMPLWAMLIPTIIDISTDEKRKDESEERK